MEFVLDESDKKILSILKSNSREKFTEIARQLNLSEGAIRKRVRTLVGNRLIEKFTIEAREMLYPVRAIVMVKLNSKAPTDKVINYIKNMSDVNSAYTVTGGYDIFVDVNTSSTKELHDKIASIRNQKGVASTLTMTVLS